ncbi:hypothetical protein M404DRAFT_33230 [Pisolithus tinctorius Marx 270]|uniref:Uncharacterized protein n=1 Tax=Pisolithus tinctorius Marx 270 TaxID=870435 RepID=A0A0C3NLD8_PISTI|nr:hypothetical protein M404DRAFT_33230 [Pisolithus tinctorius Marx 270]
MPSQRQSNTPQPTPGHIHDYSQVADEELVILTDDSTDTEREKSTEKAKREEAKRWKAEEERLEAEQRKRAEEEEEARRKKAAEEEAERQRQRASAERAQARRDEATQRLTGAVYDVNTAQKVPGASVVVTTTRRAPCTRCIGLRALSQQEEDLQLDMGRGSGGALAEESRDGELPRREEEEDREVGGEDEPVTPLEGPSGAGVHTWWVEWEREQQLQAMERQAKAHETAALAFERMAEAVEQMAVAAEQTADEWALYCAWAKWAEMRRREDAREARMSELERSGGGWKRPQSEVEDKNEEADEGAEGDNEEEEDVGGEKEGGEGQEGGGEQAMEE